MTEMAGQAGTTYRLPAFDGETKLYGVKAEELAVAFESLVACSDAELTSRLPGALHYACIVGWLREIPPDLLLSDTGVIHELVHVLTDTGTVGTLQEVRRQFAEMLTPPSAEEVDSFLRSRGVWEAPL